MKHRRRSKQRKLDSLPPPASPAARAPCPMPSSGASPKSPAHATPPPEQAPEVVVPEDWTLATDVISSDLSSPVVLVCGPSNSGKSTFTRLLLNKLLPSYGRIGYLDTDVGQPEFSPPGCLSLHIVDEAIADMRNPVLREAERCCFYGDISSKGDPESYLNSLFLLYNYFVEKYRCPGSGVLPLIVNTPGWVKGTGFDMLVEMLRYICPTIVVPIRTRMQRKNLPDGMFWLTGGETEPKVITIDAASRDSLSKSSLKRKDGCGMRERRLVEYFKQCFSSDISLASNKELAYALASLPPYEVSFSDVTVLHLHCEVPRTEIWRSLNATIVGLASSCDTPSTANAVPWCVGLGIVRGVDVQRGLLYVITPVAVQHLQSVDLLLQGLIEIPRSVLQVMACPFCGAPGGPCSSFDSSASVFTVVLDRRCSRRVYVPYSVRSHLARYIEECRALAIRRGDTDIDLALQNSEGNLYGVLFTHGRMSSKFHGPSWEELVNDYGLRHCDMMTVRLEHYGTWIAVDFHRDGVMLFPLPYVALEDLSETQRELVDSCFYSRGVSLNYHQTWLMSRQLFDDNYMLCTPFVHRIDSMNVNGQHMVIPSMVVRSLKDFCSIPRTGSLTLEITLDSEDDDISVSIPCSYFICLGNRMMLNKEGFGNFLRASSIEVNNLVLITFKERDQELAVVFNPLP